MSVGRYWENPITVERKDIVNVQQFVYLGTKGIASGESDANVQARINKAVDASNR